MEHTLYLSQVLGLSLIIVGLSIMLRKRYYVPVVGEFIEDRFMRMVMGILELLGGLFLVLAHNDWSTLPAGIISAIGWVLVIEGTAYLLVSDRMMSWMIRTFNVRTWYVVGGLLSVALGLYLALTGFGIL
ncbi:MAG TPA: hypothetical protein VGE53_01265 [Candidatus Paceibacterota bacterium]